MVIILKSALPYNYDACKFSNFIEVSCDLALRCLNCEFFLVKSYIALARIFNVGC